MFILFIFIFLFLAGPVVHAQSAESGAQVAPTPFWRANPFSSQALNPDLSVIGDFLVRGGARDAGQNAFSFREVELGFQAAVDPYSRADIFLALEEEGGKIEPDVEEAFLTLLSLPFKTQAKLGRFQLDLGRTHRTHAPERDFADTPLAFEKILGVEHAMKANGTSFNVLLPFPWDSYHELRGEIGETKTQFGEEREAIKRTERFAYGRQKNFFSLGKDVNMEISGGFGRWQTDGGIEKVGSTTTFEGRAQDLIRSLATADFALKWKPSAFRSFLLEGSYLYSSGRTLKEVSENGVPRIVVGSEEIHDRGGFLHLQYQPLRRWYVGGRVDHVLKGETGLAERRYSGILTFFPSEFSRVRFQWNRKDSDGELRDHRFFLQVTWSLGPHRPHPF